MIFQDPMSSLDPVHRIGKQIAEQIRVHERDVSKAAALERAVELMEPSGSRERATARAPTRTSSPAACASG